MSDTVRPRHVAIIADGNRRWARDRGLPLLAGHVQGIEAIRPIVRRARDAGVETFSVYTFSTENWNSSRRRGLRVSSASSTVPSASTPTSSSRRGFACASSGACTRPRSTSSARSARRRSGPAMAARLTLNICFNYSGRAEIVDAARALVAAHADPEEIDEAHFAEHLYTAGQPDVDLLIRTGGDRRTSNFLLWQAAYAELVFCDEVLAGLQRRRLRRRHGRASRAAIAASAADACFARGSSPLRSSRRSSWRSCCSASRGSRSSSASPPSWRSSSSSGCSTPPAISRRRCSRSWPGCC